MPDINLDAARAARAAVTKEPMTITVDGEKFVLPPSPKWWVFRLAKTDPAAACEKLLGNEFERFLEFADPDAEDMMFLVREALGKYGFGNQGEAQASSSSQGSRSSSTNGSKSSRQTSKGSTGSTSRKRAGAKRR